jgi:hypothetical protein
VCAFGVTAAALTDAPIDVTARTRAAKRVVVATISDIEGSRLDVNEHGDQVIITKAWLRADETLKGDRQEVLALEVEGGTVGDLTLKVSDMPVLKKGDRAVFFLNPNRAGANSLSGRGQGMLRLDSSNRMANGALTLADVKARVREAGR